MPTRNPQSNLPEPLGMITLIAGLCLNLWNAYSNARQEKNLAEYDRRQAKIIALLEQAKEREDHSGAYPENHE